MNDVEITRESVEATNKIVSQIKEEVLRKSAADLLNEFNNARSDQQEIRQDIDAKEEAARVNQKLPEAVRNSTVKVRKTDNVVQAVRQTLEAINQPNQPKIPIPEQSIGFLRKLAEIRLEEVNQNNAIFLYDLINKGIQGQLSDFNGVKSSFDSIKLLKYLDESIFNKVLRALQSRAQELGATSEQIDSLKTEQQKNVDKKMKPKEEPELPKVRAKVVQLLQRGGNMITSVKLDVKHTKEGKDIEDRYERSRREQERDGRYNREESERRREQELEQLEMKIRGNLWTKFGSIISLDETIDDNLSNSDFTRRRREQSLSEITSQDVDNHISSFQKYLDSLQVQGAIDENSFVEIRNLSEKFKPVALEAINQMRDAGSLYMEAERLMPNIWNEEDKRLLKILGSGDLSSFKEYINQNEFNGLKTIEDWEELSKKMRALFEKIFRQAEANPKQYWQEAFVEFYEGHFYKQLVGALRNLGEMIENDEELSSKKVFLWEFEPRSEMQADPELNKVSPNPLLMGKKRMNLLLSDALSNILANQMVDLKDFTEYAHNVNVLTAQGLGFDKMAEFAARLRLSDVVRMLHSIPGLSDAYNLYLENMQIELALNNHIFRTDFGDQKLHNLDRTEFMTYHQLAASIGDPTDENPKKLNSEIIRLIRLASGIAKGVTGEFWGTAWTSALPHGVERRPDGTIRTLRSYSSLSNPGVEKMMPSIDIWLSMERFGIPTPWSEIGSAFLPRDLKKPPSDFFWFKHADIYKWHAIRDGAQYTGRTDELADFDDNYQFAHELTRTSSIDYMLRGGWRFYEYRNFLVYKKDEHGNWLTEQAVDEHGKPIPAQQRYIVDFSSTMKQLMGVGPYYVQRFINDLFDPHERLAFQESISSMDISQLGESIINDLNPTEKDEALKRLGTIKKKNGLWDLSETQKNSLKQFFYEQYIFKSLLRYRPSHFLAMETKRWTPQDEVKEGRLVSDRLITFLKTKFPHESEEYIKDHYLPLYLGAVQLAEKEMWDVHKDEWRKQRKKQDAKIWSDRDEDDPLNYEFNENFRPKDGIYEGNFYEDKLKKKLITYFKMRKEISGTVQYPEGLFSIDDENFLSNVKSFTRTLIESSKEQRWSRVSKKDDSTKETLVERYAKMLLEGKGYIGHYLKGNFLDLSELHLQQAGSRSPERMFGETAVISQNVTKEMQTLIMDSLLALTRKEYKDIHEFEQAVEKTFAEPLAKIRGAITNIDFSNAIKFVQDWTLISAELMALDRRFRIKGVGNMLLDFFRRSNGTQGSFMTDKIPHSLRTPSTALDSQMLEVFIHTISEAAGVPRTEEKITGYKDLKIGGLTLIKDLIPEYDHENPNKINLEKMIHAMGADRWTQIKESAPMLVPIFVIILALLAKLAADKDKKK